MTLNNKFVKTLLGAFLLVYFLVAVISRAPAELAASVIHKAVPNLWLMGVQGSVWQGTAKGAQLDLPGYSLPLGSVNWKLSGLSLLLLNPCVIFETRDGAALISGEACRSIMGKTSLEDINIDGEISPLTEVINIPVSGLGSVQIAHAEMDGNTVEKMEARVSWQNGSINPGTGWLSVGSYGATVMENGEGGISAEIFDVDAPLKAQLVANLNIDQWQINGAVTPSDNAPQLIKDGIQLIGEEIESGTYNIVLSSD